jgi:hypothetical protein
VEIRTKLLILGIRDIDKPEGLTPNNTEGMCGQWPATLKEKPVRTALINT